MPSDTDPVVVEALRTPQGREDGVYSDTRSEDLVIPWIDEILDRNGLDGADVDDLMLGCAQQREEQANNLARVVALLSDLGEDVPGTTINRWCASSMQSIISASDAVRAGQRDAVIAAGVENMSRVEMGGANQHLHPKMATEYDVFELSMGMTAEEVAERYDVTREEMDAYSARSHHRAAEATESGRFDDEILPIETDDGLVEEDEGIRPDTDEETLAGLPPAFSGDGVVTAGNSSQISDGAAALLVTSRGYAEDRGLDVLAEIGDNNVAGVDPYVMGIGPIPATEGLMERQPFGLDDVDLVELNEAFASQTLYCQEELGIDDDIFNVNGGAIAVGHPLGASGARLPVTLIHEMQKQDADRGLATLCVGFGQGAATLYETP
jgi:acetyl-CoA acyltransferase